MTAPEDAEPAGLAERIAAIATTGDVERLGELLRTCLAAVRAGTEVRLFFRDESIPLICRAEVREQLGSVPSGTTESVGAVLQDLFAALGGEERAQLYACTSSLYLWGVGAPDLIPAMTGVRGLIAFLADDLDGASQVLSY